MPAIVTSQVTTRLFNDYQNTEITFTKDIIHTLKMDPRQNYIKSGGAQWPCIINSTSFTMARIIIGNQGGAFQELAKKRDQPVSLRFSFYQANGQLLSFFITGKIQAIQPYGNSNDLVLVNIAYTQRPPDDLILMVGRLLDANVNAVRRKDERIVITPDTLRKLGIPRKEIKVGIDNIPRPCILANLSFSGCAIILMGIPQFLKNKAVTIQLEFDDPHEFINLQGVVVDSQPIEGRKEIVSAHVHFAEGTVSLPYKIRINTFLTLHRKLDTGVQFEGEDPVVPVEQALNQAAQSQQGAAPAQQAAPQAQAAAPQAAQPSAEAKPAPDAQTPEDKAAPATN